ncbi:38833_t:CDS:2 [Gigaspora margarita]|uniref:38833_t:CDS:1 n=1 Tax=Gigaspora margarita TaxID=4874 RepID=A0ABN7U951_GIGMA|nr:38833_t:CDS:2 [Gigaspora margarita]
MGIACELNGKIFNIKVLPNNQNSLHLGFQCSCKEIKTNIELSLSKAITTCYQTIFKTKTEYSSLGVIGFKNENIIQQLIIDIEFFLIFLKTETKFIVVITSINDLNEDSQCTLEIYSELVCIKPIVEETPEEVWKKVGICQKYTRSYLFGITNILVHERLNILRNESPMCTVMPEPEPQPQKNSQDTSFWNIFRDAIHSSKRGSDGKIHILLIIALKFKAIIICTLVQCCTWTRCGQRYGQSMDMLHKKEDKALEHLEKLKRHMRWGYEKELIVNEDSNRGGTRIKKNVKAKLECFFLNKNQRNENRMNAQAMHKELLKFAKDGEIEKEDVPKISTIDNCLSSYACAFKKKATEHKLELAIQ